MNVHGERKMNSLQEVTLRNVSVTTLILRYLTFTCIIGRFMLCTLMSSQTLKLSQDDLNAWDKNGK